MSPDAKHLAGGPSLRGRALRRRLAAALLGALGAAALLGAPASAAVPTFERAFDGSTITPTPAETFTPGEIAVDEATGDIWVIDTANNVVDRFSSAGVYEAQITGVDTPRRAFSFGGFDGLAVDNSGGANQGNVYIAEEVLPIDPETNATVIYAYRSDGTFLWETVDNLNDVCGVTVDTAGRVWGSDYFRGVQQRDVTTGAAIGPAYVEGGQGCGVAFDTNANMYLAVYNGTVSRYAPTAYDTPTLVDENAVAAIAVDTSTNDLFTARIDGRIGMYDAAGTQEVGSPFGTDAYAGVTVDAESHLLYATDAANGQIEVFRTEAPPVTRRLTVTLAGTGGGRVTSSPVGIDCGSSCSFSFDEGTRVTLTGTPSNSTLTWSGGGCSGSAPCEVTLSSDTTVTATFAQNLPTVAGETASNVTDRGASLRGTVNPNGATTTCEFEYGTTTSYGTRVPCAANPGFGTSPVTVVIPTLTGLAANTTYHYRINATNAGGTANGADRTFRTSAPPAPVVVTGAASGVTQTAASLAGTVNPRGYATTCYFEYGTTTAYGSRVDCASNPGSGTSTVNVGAALSGLTAGTTYHFRLVATSAGGTVNGVDGTFTTVAAPTCATDASLCPPRTCETDASLCPPPPTPRTCATDASLCPPPGLPTLVLDSSSAVVSGGKASVKLSCEGVGTCSGRVELVARVRSSRGRSRSVVVGSASVSIAAGRAATVRVSLSRAARSALARTGRLRVTVSGLGLDESLTLRQPVRRARRARRRGRR